MVLKTRSTVPVGGGAVKHYDQRAPPAEVKRIVAAADCRGKGVAGKVLNELEKSLTRKP